MALDYEQYYAKDRKTWRKWLEKNHRKKDGIWLIYYKKGSDKTRVPYADAVEEALCFGWIDTTSRPIDDEKYMQLFVPRKPKSEWSRLNKERVERLISEGLMTEAGLEKIAIAKENGHWSKIDHVEDFIVPADLEKAFRANKGTKNFFEGLGKTNKKYILHWLGSAKREETRIARIQEIIQAFNQNKMPDRYIRKKP